MTDVNPSPEGHGQEPSRRDFIYIAAGGAAAIGGAFLLWPFIDQMNPAADTLAVSTTEVNLADVAEGEQLTVMYQGKPTFVRHRTAEEVAAARETGPNQIPDGDSRNLNLVEGSDATDQHRSAMAAGVRDGVEVDATLRERFIIMLANCTHLGCVPVGQSGDYHGWYCPCHGSHYDTAGRIRRGPAPENLHIPPYTFLSGTTIRIG
nr:ubiquinol-cytochrome c reductase iron-sulfur subunit [Woodsholea maritima]